METEHAERTVDVIIPARNEEDCLGRCLASLVVQQGTLLSNHRGRRWLNGPPPSIAESFPGVRVISATEPKPGVMGSATP